MYTVHCVIGCLWEHCHQRRCSHNKRQSNTGDAEFHCKYVLYSLPLFNFHLFSCHQIRKRFEFNGLISCFEFRSLVRSCFMAKDVSDWLLIVPSSFCRHFWKIFSRVKILQFIRRLQSFHVWNYDNNIVPRFCKTPKNIVLLSIGCVVVLLQICNGFNHLL